MHFDRGATCQMKGVLHRPVITLNTLSSMASGINIYSQLLISTIRIVDVNNLDHTSDTKYMSTVYGLR